MPLGVVVRQQNGMRVIPQRGFDDLPRVKSAPDRWCPRCISAGWSTPRSGSTQSCRRAHQAEEQRARVFFSPRARLVMTGFLPIALC